VRPWKGIGEADDLGPVRLTVDIMVAARGLDRTFDRLGARIGEEDGVGEAVVDSRCAKASPCGTAIEVRHMHQRRRLLG
jgi:hypothetical protein